MQQPVCCERGVFRAAHGCFVWMSTTWRCQPWCFAWHGHWHGWWWHGCPLPFTKTHQPPRMTTRKGEGCCVLGHICLLAPHVLGCVGDVLLARLETVCAGWVAFDGGGWRCRSTTHTVMVDVVVIGGTTRTQPFCTTKCVVNTKRVLCVDG